MRIANKFNLPEPLVSVAENDPYPYEEVGDLSTTTAIKPPRIVQLQKRHRGELVEDVSEKIFLLIGTNAHHILERVKTPYCVKEQRYYASVKGWKVSGQIDLYEMNTKTLSDYKVTSVWSVINIAKPEHIAQMNINRWLMEINDIKVNKLQIVNLLRDWSKHQVAKSDNYPKCQVVIQGIPIWNLNDTLKFIFDRVELHQKCVELSSDDLPYCTPEERWEKPTMYAVMKKGRKSAIRVLESEDLAGQYIKNCGLDDKHFITARPGESTRCLHYCNVRDFCNQFKEMKGE